MLDSGSHQTDLIDDLERENARLWELLGKCRDDIHDAAVMLAELGGGGMARGIRDRLWNRHDEITAALEKRDV